MTPPPSSGAVNECCNAYVPIAGGWHQEGEKWNCPVCNTEWTHVIEESEGCWWERQMDIESSPEDIEDLQENMYRLGYQHGQEKANYIRLTDTEQRLEELRSLFETQQKRMQQATEFWRAEQPKERELIMPDLGDLLTWLMEKAGIITEVDPEEEKLTEESGGMRLRAAVPGACTHPDDRGRECRHCGKYVRGDDNG